MLIFRVITPCGFADRHQRFEGTKPPEDEGLLLCSSEMLVSTYKSTRRNTPEDQHRRLQIRENLKCHNNCSCM
jgi:hypothetical protein